MRRAGPMLGHPRGVVSVMSLVVRRGEPTGVSDVRAGRGVGRGVRSSWWGRPPPAPKAGHVVGGPPSQQRAGVCSPRDGTPSNNDRLRRARCLVQELARCGVAAAWRAPDELALHYYTSRQGLSNPACFCLWRDRPLPLVAGQVIGGPLSQQRCGSYSSRHGTPWNKSGARRPSCLVHNLILEVRWPWRGGRPTSARCFVLSFFFCSVNRS